MADGNSKKGKEARDRASPMGSDMHRTTARTHVSGGTFDSIADLDRQLAIDSRPRDAVAV